MKLFDRFWRRGAFAEPMPRTPVMEEIATTSNGRDITRGYVDSLPLLPPTDSILQTRGGGDLRIYDEVARDTQVKTCVQQRWMAVASKEWEVDPGDSSRKARKAADHLRDVLSRNAWDDLTVKMLSGEFYGYAVSEALWARDGGSITLDGIKVRHPRRFGFSPKGELKLLTSSNPNGEILPPAKFWAFSTGTWHDDDPYGLGLAHWLYWPVFFKRNGIKFWLIFLEKFGMPTAIGKYGAGATPEEKDRLLEALEAIQSDSGIRIPEGMEITLLEAARSGTADYTALYDRMDGAISKVILGHTGSTDATPGRLGGEDNASEVREDLIKAASDLICMSFNRTIATWLTRFNDDSAPIPRVWRRVTSEPDLKAQADRDKVLFDMGFKPTLKYVTETYDVEVVERPNAAAKPDATAQAGNPQELQTAPAQTEGQFAEPATAVQRPDTVDRQTERLAMAADPLIDEWLIPVRELLRESSDLGEFRDKLSDLFPKMDTQALAEQFSEAFLAANLAGRYEAER